MAIMSLCPKKHIELLQDEEINFWTNQLDNLLRMDWFDIETLGRQLIIG